jgi:hypothetical protein
LSSRRKLNARGALMPVQVQGIQGKGNPSSSQKLRRGKQVGKEDNSGNYLSSNCFLTSTTLIFDKLLPRPSFSPMLYSMLFLLIEQ